MTGSISRLRQNLVWQVSIDQMEFDGEGSLRIGHIDHIVITFLGVGQDLARHFGVIYTFSVALGAFLSGSLETGLWRYSRSH